MLSNISSKLSEEHRLNIWNDALAKTLAPLTAVFVLYVIIGCVGNTLVMYIHWFRMKKHQEERFFIPCLALFDAIACTVCTVSGIIANLLPVKFSSDIGCKMAAFGSLLFVNISADILVVVAVERYLKICKPFNKQMSMRNKKHSIIVICVISIVVAVPIIWFFGASQVYHPTLNATGWRCTNLPSIERELDVMYTIFLLVYVISRYVILTTLYILIGRSIFRQIRSRQSLAIAGHYLKSAIKDDTRDSLSSDIHEDDNSHQELDNNACNLQRPIENREHLASVCEEKAVSSKINVLSLNSQRRRRKGLRFSFIFMLITVIYIVSFGPKLVLMIIEAVDRHFWARKSLPEVVGLRFLYYLFVVNNIVNPFIYGFFDTQFRKQFILLIRKKKRT